MKRMRSFTHVCDTTPDVTRPPVSKRFAESEHTSTFDWAQRLIALDAVKVNGERGPSTSWSPEVRFVEGWRGDQSMKSEGVVDSGVRLALHGHLCLQFPQFFFLVFFFCSSFYYIDGLANFSLKPSPHDLDGTHSVDSPQQVIPAPVPSPSSTSSRPSPLAPYPPAPPLDPPHPAALPMAHS